MVSEVRYSARKTLTPGSNSIKKRKLKFSQIKGRLCERMNWTRQGLLPPATPIGETQDEEMKVFGLRAVFLTLFGHIVGYRSQ